MFEMRHEINKKKNTTLKNDPKNKVMVIFCLLQPTLMA